MIENKNQHGFLHFWILHSSSGLTIFSQKFQNFEMKADAEIMGGFFSALLAFAGEIDGQQISFIQLTDFRIQYCIRPDVVMVALTTNSADPNRTNGLMNHVQDEFHVKYNVKNFSGNISQFSDFAKVTERIFGAETQYLTIIRTRTGSIESYFGQFSKEWKEINDKISQHAYMLKQWGLSNIISINQTIQRDLLDARMKEKAWKQNTARIVGQWV
jgi:hypothetical protein